MSDIDIENIFLKNKENYKIIILRNIIYKLNLKVILLDFNISIIDIIL